jgi:hypothetical protein
MAVCVCYGPFTLGGALLGDAVLNGTRLHVDSLMMPAYAR